MQRRRHAMESPLMWGVLVLWTALTSCSAPKISRKNRSNQRFARAHGEFPHVPRPVSQNSSFIVGASPGEVSDGWLGTDHPRHWSANHQARLLGVSRVAGTPGCARPERSQTAHTSLVVQPASASALAAFAEPHREPGLAR